MNVRKTTIGVIAEFGNHGLTPLSIIWYDGRCYPVDRVLDVQKAANRRVGGRGQVYTCMIGGRERKLWREGDGWFVEEVVGAYGYDGENPPAPHCTNPTDAV